MDKAEKAAERPLMLPVSSYNHHMRLANVNFGGSDSGSSGGSGDYGYGGDYDGSSFGSDYASGAYGGSDDSSSYDGFGYSDGGSEGYTGDFGADYASGYYSGGADGSSSTNGAPSVSSAALDVLGSLVKTGVSLMGLSSTSGLGLVIGGIGGIKAATELYGDIQTLQAALASDPQGTTQAVADKVSSDAIAQGYDLNTGGNEAADAYTNALTSSYNSGSNSGSNSWTNSNTSTGGTMSTAAGTQASYEEQALAYLQEREAQSQALSSGAMSQLGDIYGITGDGTGQSAFIESLKQDPFYTSMIASGEDAVLRNKSATGGLRSGSANVALAESSQDVLSNLYSQRVGELQGMAGYGTDGTNVAGAMTDVGSTLAAGQLASDAADEAEKAQQLELAALAYKELGGVDGITETVGDAWTAVSGWFV